MAGLISNEHPQTIALIFSKLEPSAAAQLAKALPAPLTMDAMRRLLHMNTPHQNAVDAAERTLIEAMADLALTLPAEGHERVARIFDRLDSRSEKQFLAAIENAAPDAPALKPRLQYAALPNRATDVPTGRVPSPNSRPLGAAQLGALGTPAAGRLVRAWGEKMPGGTKSEGIFIATRADAQVSAPIDGKIEFAGPFRTYGELLIISTSDGYHILLSGMATSYVSVGQSVKRGEPVALVSSDGASLGAALSAYHSEEAEIIAGHQSAEIEGLLGYAGRAAMVHRDDIVLWD